MGEVEETEKMAVLQTKRVDTRITSTPQKFPGKAVAPRLHCKCLLSVP